MNYSQSSWALMMCKSNLALSAIRNWSILPYHPLEITLGDPANSHLVGELRYAEKNGSSHQHVTYLKYAN